MVTYWGWSDTALNPQMGIAFYENLMKSHGRDDVQAFYRLFMIPGVSHCEGSYGPGGIDSLSPVIDRVERGLAPSRLLAMSAANAAVQNRLMAMFSS